MRTHQNKTTDRLQADANTYAPGERKQLLLDAKQEIINLRTALLLYHEAWNGCEGDWKGAMKRASANADAILWPEEQATVAEPSNGKS
jgi:hypothetical protein